MPQQQLTLIRSVSSWKSGGGIDIDIIELKDGRVLGVTDDSVVLYDDIGDLESGEARIRPVIEL